MDFFDMGFLEILVIMVVALLVIGPEKLPEYARKMGTMMRKLKRMTKDLTGEMTKSLDLGGEMDELKNTAKDLENSLDEESLKIKKTLDLEADEIAKTIDTEVSGVKKTIDEGTSDLATMLEKEATEFDKTAKEMKKTLDGEAKELNQTLNAGVKKINKTLNVDNPATKGFVKPVSGPRSNPSLKKKTGETPEKTDTVEAAKEVEKTVAEQAVETNPAEKKAETEEVRNE